MFFKRFYKHFFEGNEVQYLLGLNIVTSLTIIVISIATFFNGMAINHQNKEIKTMKVQLVELQAHQSELQQQLKKY